MIVHHGGPEAEERQVGGRRHGRRQVGRLARQARGDLSRIMGHADIKTTMRYYVRQKLDDLKVAVDAMDGGDVGNRWQ